MKIHEYKERDDGGADLQVELDAEESRLLIEIGLIKVLKDTAEQHEKLFEGESVAEWQSRVEEYW